MHITSSERNELQVMLRAHNISAVQAQRAKLILALADGLTYAEIMEQLGVSPTYITRWKGRFVDDPDRRLRSVAARKRCNSQPDPELVLRDHRRVHFERGLFDPDELRARLTVAP
jgi:transcriptional regulator with XRE-family HTH domain